MEASYNKKAFVAEDEYSWSFSNSINEQESKMVQAWLHWRTMQKGAFSDWTVLLVLPEDHAKRDSVNRVLVSGGARVFTCEKKVIGLELTHVLCRDTTNLKHQFPSSIIYPLEYFTEYLYNPYKVNKT